jgi:hypothetical protein
MLGVPMRVADFLIYKQNSFFNFLKERKCEIDDPKNYLKKTVELYKKLNIDDDEYFFVLLHLVGRQYCVTVGDIVDFFGLDPNSVLQISRKISRKLNMKYKWNIDACIKRICEYCNINENEAQEILKNFISFFGSGRLDVLLTFSAGFIYGCDVKDLFGVSLSALKYHLKNILFGQLNFQQTSEYKKTDANS